MEMVPERASRATVELGQCLSRRRIFRHHAGQFRGFYLFVSASLNADQREAHRQPLTAQRYHSPHTLTGWEVVNVIHIMNNNNSPPGNYYAHWN